jgi:hypothetical protein
VAHVADNSSTFSNPSGNAATLVRHSETGVWDTMLTTLRGDTVPPHYGFSFRAEYDMRNNVFYFLTRRSSSTSDIWAYRYKNAPSAAVKSAETPDGNMKLSVSPNPFCRTVSIVLENIEGPFRIFNVSGKRVASGYGLWTPGNLPPGLYMVRAGRAPRVMTKRIIYAP